MKPTIGLIGLTAQLYAEKIPEKMPAFGSFARTLADTLKDCADVTVAAPVHTREAVETAVHALRRKADGVILVFLSYSPSMITAPALAGAPELPVLIWNTQKLDGIGPEFSHDDLLFNHGMHGVQDLASVLGREKRAFALVTGHYRDAAVVARVAGWCRAAAARRALASAVVGRIGGRFPDMGDFAVPDELLTRLAGPRVADIPLERLAAESLAADSGAVAQLLTEERSAYAVDAGVDTQTHAQSARLELGLRRVMHAEKLSALAINFLGLAGHAGAEAIPFAAIAKFLAEGYGYGGEGDALSATAVLLLQKAAGPSSFVEMFTTDYRNSRIFMSHMGESNPALARPGSRVALVKKDLALVKPGLATTMLLFPMKPGRVTLLNLAPDAAGLRLIACGGEVESAPLRHGILSPHFFLKPDLPVEEFLTAYSNLGGTHHLGMAYGDHRETLRFFAGISGLPLHEIGS